MATSPQSTELEFQRTPWITEDPFAREWANELVWRLLNGTAGEAASFLADKASVSEESLRVARHVLRDGNLLGFAKALCGEEKITLFFGKEFWEEIELSARRSEILTQEVRWLLGPKLLETIIVLEDLAARPLYVPAHSKEENPRHLSVTTLWAPTLSARDATAATLLEGGYVSQDKGEGYRFSKATLGVSHHVRVRSSLWETTKNWASDIERDIWSRARPSSALSGLLALELTDQFILSLRFFGIDSLLGSPIKLLDLVTMVEREREALDWDRVKFLKSKFAKPDWIWAPLLALNHYEQRTGRGLGMPDWVELKIMELHESFWETFVDSRLSWANPDARFVEFSRAHSKLCKGG